MSGCDARSAARLYKDQTLTTTCIPSLKALSEASAIERLKNGESAHFEVIYRMHNRRVYSLCWRMVGNRAIAEELTQETFMLVFRRITTFRGDSAFTTWLHRLTVNVVLMYLRQQKSRGQEVPYEDPGGTEDNRPTERYGAPDKVLVRSEERILLLRAISRLPQGYRIVFVLHDIEGYEHAEIAEMLGCSVGNTKSQLHKARMKMQQLCEAQEENVVSNQCRRWRAIPISGAKLLTGNANMRRSALLNNAPNTNASIETAQSLNNGSPRPPSRKQRKTGRPFFHLNSPRSCSTS